MQGHYRPTDSEPFYLFIYLFAEPLNWALCGKICNDIILYFPWDPVEVPEGMLELI